MYVMNLWAKLALSSDDFILFWTRLRPRCSFVNKLPCVFTMLRDSIEAPDRNLCI